MLYNERRNKFRRSLYKNQIGYFINPFDFASTPHKWNNIREPTLPSQSSSPTETSFKSKEIIFFLLFANVDNKYVIS